VILGLSGILLLMIIVVVIIPLVQLKLKQQRKRALKRMQEESERIKRLEEMRSFPQPGPVFINSGALSRQTVTSDALAVSLPPPGQGRGFIIPGALIPPSDEFNEQHSIPPKHPQEGLSHGLVSFERSASFDPIKPKFGMRNFGSAEVLALPSPSSGANSQYTSPKNKDRPQGMGLENSSTLDEKHVL
jgi:hypothetical protein